MIWGCEAVCGRYTASVDGRDLTDESVERKVNYPSISCPCLLRRSKRTRNRAACSFPLLIVKVEVDAVADNCSKAEETGKYPCS